MFWHKLALGLGMSIYEAQQKISTTEFRSWQAFYALEPFGEARTEFMLAQLCCIVANSNRGKSTKAFKVGDFIPKYGEQKRHKTGAELEAIFKQFANLHNKRVK